MRRVVAGLITPLLAASALLASASGVAADTPGHGKLGGYVVDFAAGTACPFALQWEATPGPGGANIITFPVSANGDQVILTAGHDVFTTTNLDTGASISDSRGGQILYVFHPDGTLDVKATGTNSFNLFVTDVGGPGDWWFHGLWTGSIDAAGNTVSWSFNGNLTDLCAALGG